VEQRAKTPAGVKRLTKRPNILLERIESRIFLIRGQKVMLAVDLAALYSVPVRQLNQAVKRNGARFPADFCFQLSKQEHDILKSQFVTSKIGPFDRRGGAHRALPYAFTEEGVAMLSAVLRSDTAVAVSIEIMRVFVRLRRLLATHEPLRRKLQALEHRLAEHDEKFAVVFDAIRQMLAEPPEPQKPPIGYEAEGGRQPAPHREARKSSATA
jgi:ORF6N domain-containing protein